MKSLRWEIESKCNLNCKHCFIGDLEFKDDLSLEKKLQICEKLIDKNVESVALTTKEPLLNKNNLIVIKKLTKANIRVLLVTNGTLIDNDYAAKIIESGIDGIAISLEGVSDKSNDAIRGKGSFLKAINGLLNINNAMIFAKRVVSISIQMTLNKYNYNEINNILDFFDKYSINSLSIGTISESGNAVNNRDIILSDYQYFIACMKIAKEYRYKFKKSFVLEFKSLSPWETILINLITGANICYYVPNCSAKDGVYSLTSSGKIIPCISLNETYTSSDVDLLNKRLDFCWEDISNDFRKKNKELNVKSGVCLSCHFEPNCTPCPAALKEYGDKSSIFKKCEIAIKHIENIAEKVIEDTELNELILNPGIYRYIEDNLEITRIYSNGVKLKHSIALDRAKSELVINQRWKELFSCCSGSELKLLILELIGKDLVYILGGEKYETDF